MSLTERLAAPRPRISLTELFAKWVLHPFAPGRAEPWRVEMDTIAWRYHVTGSWVAALLNPVFILNDLAVIPSHWISFAAIRLVVSALIIAALLGRQRLRLDPRTFLLVPYLLISLENAYMWGHMGPELFRMHTLAYAVLFVGAAMIAFWPLRWSLLVVGVTVLANMWSLHTYSSMTTAEVMANGGTLFVCVLIISTMLCHNRYRLAKREILLRLQLAERTEQARAQKLVIEAAHRDLTDSIRYSQRIQQALLPRTEVLDRHLSEHFILNRPKDIVSGDLHWCAHRDGCTVVAVADCTGHGVPGALMSILGSTLMKTIVQDRGTTAPAAILGQLRDEVVAALSQGQEAGQSDGMDMALCTVDHADGVLRFAGAFSTGYLVRQGELIELTPDRWPVGAHVGVPKPFNEQQVVLHKGDMIYLCSDGFQDQFGGKLDKKFGRARLKKLFTQLAHLPAREQHHTLRNTLELWQRELPAVDDVLVLGFRV